MSDKKHHQHDKDSITQKLPVSLSEQLGKKDTLDSVLEHYKDWLPKYQELAQGRSNFQIEKIIATEHATPAASYQHTLYQLRVLHQALIDDFVNGIEHIREFEHKWKDKDKDEPVWWETERGGKKLCWYDTDRLRHEHRMEELKMSVKDKLLQLETFTKVLSSMEKKHGGTFTLKHLNDEEPEYWKLRLARQMTDQYLDRQTNLGTGNIKTLRMALAESPIEGSKNKVEDFPDLINATLSDRQKALQTLNEINDRLFKEMDGLGAHDSRLEKAPENPRVEPDNQRQTQRLYEAGIGISELED